MNNSYFNRGFKNFFNQSKSSSFYKTKFSTIFMNSASNQGTSKKIKFSNNIFMSRVLQFNNSSTFCTIAGFSRMINSTIKSMDEINSNEYGLIKSELSDALKTYGSNLLLIDESALCNGVCMTIDHLKDNLK